VEGVEGVVVLVLEGFGAARFGKLCCGIADPCWARAHVLGLTGLAREATSDIALAAAPPGKIERHMILLPHHNCWTHR
jgi:hypothetical protein